MNRKLVGGSGSKTKTKGQRDKGSFPTIGFTSFVFPRNNDSKQLTMIFLMPGVEKNTFVFQVRNIWYYFSKWSNGNLVGPRGPLVFLVVE